jgi:serine phosphatase RsbU (regulator of sigma subunit)
MPLLVRQGGVEQLKQSNLPVGLIQDADYDAAMLSLVAGDRVLLVTDGVTEAEDPKGEFYGDARLQTAASDCKSLQELFDNIMHYCSGAPATDDCTMLEVRYMCN